MNDSDRFALLHKLQNKNTTDFTQAHVDLFLGKWKNWGKVLGNDEEAECKDSRTGWSDKELVDDSDLSDSEWMSKRRPGMFGKKDRGEGEGWTDHEDEKLDDDSDDNDDNGGHMMPIPH